MESIAFIAEQKIVQAMKERDLTASKWKNKPLPLDDDRLVPDDLKMAYKLLKNSGYLPPEIEERKEVQKLEDLIAATEDEHERVRQMKKLNVLLMKVEARRSFTSNIASQQDYYQKVVERISVKSKVPGK
ncbi:DnaJ family domain-containing protein [Desulforhopalus singaporensis]|nr:DnaJ family domain-containing protein [Desulforhopalus singaporensis]